MRLLNVKTRRLEEFDGSETPKYAILSHTWGDHEITFRNVRPGRRCPSSIKIAGACLRALRDELEYIWIDTVCIDKSSSSELSEAINSMFAWYSRASVCYVHLADVSSEHYEAIAGSRWFTRGWTLQELLAPRRVVFLNRNWDLVECLDKDTRLQIPGCHQTEFVQFLSRVTRIAAIHIGLAGHYQRASVAQKMSWAAHRNTRRKEDQAYCLLGIFDVNMPLLYGEGSKAFKRLQEEIMRTSDDHTLFAWGYNSSFYGPLTSKSDLLVNNAQVGNLLAGSPDDFSGCTDVIRKIPKGRKVSHYFVTNMGVHISLPWRRLPDTGPPGGIVALNCTTSLEATSGKCMALPLLCSDIEGNKYHRSGFSKPFLVPEDFFEATEIRAVYVRTSSPYSSLDFRLKSPLLVPGPAPHDPNRFLEIYPPNWVCAHADLGELNFYSSHDSRSPFVILRSVLENGLDCLLRVSFNEPGQASGLEASLGLMKGIESESLIEFMIRHDGNIDEVVEWKSNLQMAVSNEMLTSSVYSDDLVTLIHVDSCPPQEAQSRSISSFKSPRKRRRPWRNASHNDSAASLIDDAQKQEVRDEGRIKATPKKRKKKASQWTPCANRTPSDVTSLDSSITRHLEASQPLAFRLSLSSSSGEVATTCLV